MHTTFFLLQAMAFGCSRTTSLRWVFEVLHAKYHMNCRLTEGGRTCINIYSTTAFAIARVIVMKLANRSGSQDKHFTAICRQLDTSLKD